ncbi:dickkopf-related protein 4-like [Betta splendens]|uniref:Dickkopf-related protein 4-like n=1 Tax=Betta splendens TaxID=158456 RepID=A0A6P7KVR4_BETSP|nr:dickkopf-related protein 4-like [Betta splendens]
MTRQLLLVLSVGLVLKAAEARVRLNPIRTLVLGEGLAPNRSLWEPSLVLTLYQCMSDLECEEGSYCHSSTKGPARSHCHACRRRRRRCRRDSMCCPGNHCSSGLCVPDSVVFARQRTLLMDVGVSPPSEAKPWRKRKRTNVKAQAGDSCLRSSDCSAGLCCAQHFWSRICKAVLREGQVCSQQRRRPRRRQRLELFQRCSCGSGLSCQALRDPGTEASSSSPPSSSSPLLAAAAKSRFGASSSPPSTWSAAKTRLHVCQKN